NFTLDESLEIKQHYTTKLSNLKRMLGADKDSYIHSKGFVLMILGDLYYFDQEYDDAIIHYRDAVQNLKELIYKSNPEDRKDIFNIVLLTRNLLKLGLCYEKKKTYDSTFTVFGQITDLLADVRKLAEADYAQEYLLNNRANTKFSIGESFEGQTIENPFFLKKERNTWHNTVQKSRTSYSEGKPQSFSDALRALPLSSSRIKLAQKISTLEGIRLIYQPLLAKLYVKEKASLGGVNYSDIDRVEDEFRYMTKIIDLKEKFLIKAEFYNKLGDLLYFKNGFLDEKTEKKKIIYCHTEESFCNKNEHVDATGKLNIIDVDNQKYFRSPCSSCKMYMKSLETLCDTGELIGNPKVKLNNTIYNLLGHLQQVPTDKFTRENYISSLANNLFKIGDTFLSCMTKEHEIKESFLIALLSSINEAYDAKTLIQYIGFNDISKAEEALCYFFLSSAYFRQIGSNNNCATQVLRILYVIDMYTSERKVTFTDNVFKLIESNLLTSYFSFVYRSFDNTHRPEIATFQDTFDGDFEKVPFALQNISASGEFKEAVILYNRLKLKHQLEEVSYKSLFVEPNSMINNSFNRIHELRLKGRMHSKIFETLFNTKTLNSLKSSILDFDQNKIDEFRENTYKIKKSIDNFKKEIREFYARRNVEINVLLDKIMIIDKTKDIKLQKDYLLSILEELKNVLIVAITYKIFTLLNMPKEKLEEKDINDFKNKIKENIISKDENLKNKPIKEVLEFIILDAIFCYINVIRILKVHGESYVVNHSQLAQAYKQLAKWCKYYEHYKILIDDKKAEPEDKLDNKLEEYIGKSDLINIKENYNLEMAKDHYYKALNTHNERQVYQFFIADMYYLDDDFNDHLTHFCAATERFWINSGKIQKQLEGINRTLASNTKLYSIGQYLNDDS
ncbi:MAG: hypothetical protein ACPGEC_05115, partial [Flavobacteriales bacterium]